MVTIPERFGWNAYSRTPARQLPAYLHARLMWMLDLDARAKTDWKKRQEREANRSKRKR